MYRSNANKCTVSVSHTCTSSAHFCLVHFFIEYCIATASHVTIPMCNKQYIYIVLLEILTAHIIILEFFSFFPNTYIHLVGTNA